MSRAGGPDNLPNWELKMYSDILAPALTEVLNESFEESKVPRVWKLADVPPLSKGNYIEDFNKDLEAGNSNASGTGLVRVSAQGLVSILQ